MRPLIKRICKNHCCFELNSLQNSTVKIINEKVKNKKYILEKSNCICGGEDDLLIGEIDRYGIEINTVLCKNCGLVRSNPYYNNETLTNFYENEYRPLYVGVDNCTEKFFENQKEIGESIYEYIKEFLTKKGIDAVIYEIGCGAGGILKTFQEKGYKTVGCDFNENYLEYGRSKGVNLVNGDCNSLKEYGTADLIILNHVLEHFKDPLTALKDIRGLLNKDGILYIRVPGIYDINFTYKGDVFLYLQNAHAFHYTLTTLIYVLNLANFKIVRGNESVQAIFRISNSILELEQNNKEARKILLYLLKTEFFFKHKILKMIFNFPKRLIRLPFKLMPLIREIFIKLFKK